MAYQRVTLADLRTLLAARWEGAAFWTTAEGDLAINASLRQFNLATGLWKTTVHLPTGANQVYYPVPGALIHTVRVQWRSSPLVREEVTAMDLWRETWPGETTASGRPVPSVVTRWIPVGVTQIAIWPADHLGASIMTVDGVRQTPTLTQATDHLNLGDEDLDGILGYSLQQVAFKGPRDRWRAIRPAGLKAFYVAAARHNPRLLTVPALAGYFADQLDQRRSTRPPVGPPGVSAGNVEAR